VILSTLEVKQIIFDRPKNRVDADCIREQLQCGGNFSVIIGIYASFPRFAPSYIIPEI
jgi:hypothetical protein